MKDFVDNTDMNIEQQDRSKNKEPQRRAMHRSSSAPGKTWSAPSIPAPQCSPERLMPARETSPIDDFQLLQAPPSTNDVLVRRPEMIEDNVEAPLPPSQAAAAYEAMDTATKRTNENTNSIEEERMAQESGAPKSPSASILDQGRPVEPSPQFHNHSIGSTVPVESHLYPCTRVADDLCSLNSGQAQEEDTNSISLTMPPHRNEEPSAPSLPMVEATCVQESQEPVYDAFTIQENNSSYWKRNQKIILAVLIALVFGAMAATFGSLVGTKNNHDNNANGNEAARGDIPGLTSSTASLYYADRTSRLCDNNPSREPSTNIQQRYFATIEECCRTEFWLQADDCMISSLGISTSSSTTTLATTASTAASTTTASTTTASTTALTSSNPSLASNVWIQQGHAIPGDATGDEAGRSLALSADGTTLAIGAPGDPTDDRRGYVKIYHKEAHQSIWKQLGLDIQGQANGDNLGQSLSLSANGRTLAIGAPGYWNKNDRPGYVRVYFMEGADLSWKQLGQDITGQAVGDQFGISVSISSDGKTLAVGANTNDGNGVSSGQVSVYRIDHIGTDTSWKQLGQEIIGDTEYDNSGNPVALSGDGNTLAIGAFWNDGNGKDSGHVRVYEMGDDGNNGDTWEQVGQDIYGQSSDDFFGYSIALSLDGSLLAIGAPASDDITSRAGYVRVYQRDGSSSSFEQRGNDVVGEAPNDSFGISVALSKDGKILAIGGHGNDGNGDSSGHVRVYHLDSAGLQWTQLGQDINGEKAGDNAGWRVSLSADGKTLAIGSIWNDDNGDKSGHVRVFRFEG